MNDPGYIKKQTLYLAVVAALLIGFLGGVVFSVYRTPAGVGQPQATTPQKEASAAIASLEKATRDKPSDAQAWVELGHAYFDTGQASKAITAYTKALELKPGDLNVMTDLGIMYHQENLHQQAIDIFDQVLKIDPKHEQARFNKGVVLLAGLGDRKRALAEWKTLVQYNPNALAPSGKLVRDLIEQMEKEDQAKK
jgi:cytochrome c-type biogenesis protein CcmH/NrfG